MNPEHLLVGKSATQPFQASLRPDIERKRGDVVGRAESLESARAYSRLLDESGNVSKYAPLIADAFRSAGEIRMCEVALELALRTDPANAQWLSELTLMRSDPTVGSSPTVRSPTARTFSVEVCCPTLNRHREVIRLRNSLPDDCIFTPSLETQPRALTAIVNELFAKSSGDIVVMAADHLEFRTGCIDAIVETFAKHFPDLDGCVGLNISNLPHLRNISEFCFVALGRPFIRRFYAEGEYQGVFCPQYYHFYGDTEFGLFAEKVGKFVYDERAAVRTWHPNAGNTKPDSTYSASRSRKRFDDGIWKRRRAAGILWGETFARVNEAEAEAESRAEAPAPKVDIMPGSPFGRRHAEKIVGVLRPGMTVLSWGTDQAHTWLADRAPAGCRVIAVDQAAEPPSEAAVQLVLLSGSGHEARLAKAREFARSDTVVFVHDAQRTAYDSAKAQFVSWGHIGSCADRPGSDLWWGAIVPSAEDARATGCLPLIVCFYTKDTPYEDEAKKLIASCERNHIEYRVVGLESRGSWEANCSIKAEFIRDLWKSAGRPVLWVDSDAIVHRPPNLFRGIAADFAAHRCREWELLSGTIFFNQTPAAGALLDRWVSRCRQFPEVWDQQNLDLAWEELITTTPLETLWLPETYCRIFDLHEVHVGAAPVIEHFQASRRLKGAVSHVANVRKAVTTETLIAARKASRVRSWNLRPRDVVAAGDAATRNLMLELVEVFSRDQTAGRKILCRAENPMAAELLVDRGFDVHALDWSPEEVNPPNGPDIPMRRSAAIPYVAGEFDAVFCYGGLDLLDPECRRAAIEELKRVTHGRVVVFLNGWPDAEDRWPGYCDRLPEYDGFLRDAGFCRVFAPVISGNVGTFVHNADPGAAAVARANEIRGLQAEVQRLRDQVSAARENEKAAETRAREQRLEIGRYYEITAGWMARVQAARLLADARQRELAVKVIMEGLKLVESTKHPRVTFEALTEFGCALAALEPVRARHLLVMAAQCAEKLGDGERLQRINEKLAKLALGPDSSRSAAIKPTNTVGLQAIRHTA